MGWKITGVTSKPDLSCFSTFSARLLGTRVEFNVSNTDKIGFEGSIR